MKKTFAIVLAALVLSVPAFAQSVVNQGKPGTQGPWPVSISGITIMFDGGITIAPGTVIVATGPDGGAVQVNITQSIPLQVIIIDGGVSGSGGTVVATGPDGGAVMVNITQSIPIQIFMDGGQRVIADQGTNPWACYVAMDGGQQIIVNQGTSPWVVSGIATGPDGGAVPVNITQSIALQVFMDGGQQMTVNQGTSPWITSGIATGPDGGAVMVNITQSIALQVFMDGGQRIIADQGTSPWVVSGAVSISTDGGFLGSVAVVFDGGSVSTIPVQCRSTALDGGSVEQNTTVGAAATQVPASPSVGRVYVNICNSAQNASTAIVKCRQDGVAPVFAAGNPGQVLLFGDCLLTTAPTTTDVVRCIADAAGRNVTTYECVPL